ncbi:VanZ family protein [Demequina sp. NBRC 110051]|uniref:VanZ family protein n=1 Tax=Demequina sp. NBRC 110051 TaxID=1570340 RepID=UPI0009FBD35D|nr:VanZ family protein [Demequina sp. NBRC 110051]
MDQYVANAVLVMAATAALIPLAMLPILGHTVRYYGRLRGWPMIAALGLMGSAVALAVFTILPLPSAEDLACTVDIPWQLDPGASLAQIIDLYEARGARGLLGTFTFWQFTANIALFVPFGFFLHQASRWPGIAVIAVGASASMLIELSQGTGFFGIFPCPYRVFDVDDLIANTAGAILGLIASYIAIGLFPFTRPPREPDLAAPGRIRRGVAGTADLAIGLGAMVAIEGGQAILTVLADGYTSPEPVDISPEVDMAVRIGVAAVLGLAVPLIRRDRATLGQALMNIAPVRVDRGMEPPARWSALVRAVIRWVPWVLSPTLVGPLVAMAEIAASVVRRDRRSLAALASLTRTRSVPSIRADRYTASAETTVMDPLE